MSIALAIKYRPKTFDDLTEQEAVVTILENQIMSNTIKHGYLFCGGAGTGKTTSARIFANMINKGSGTPIELDAASNNSVEDIRRLTEDAQTQALDSEYKVFVIDECHSLSNQAWQAFLKTLEEPPVKSIFILCTTNPEKIPQTILSRVQRYNFQRISFEGIVNRLKHIWDSEVETWCLSEKSYCNEEALEYIAKIADGGMRDAITLMDKCLSYSKELTLGNVVKALGVADYDTMYNLTRDIFTGDKADIITVITEVYNSGMDLKLFMKNYFEFILDLSIYAISKNIAFTKIPNNFEGKVKELMELSKGNLKALLQFVTDLQSEIKWEQNVKAAIIAKFLLFE